MEEIPFADGNVTGAVRVGETVRRRTGPWTPAVHALLRRLEAAGFAGAPRVLGFDERGREVLTFIPGETSPDPRMHFGADAALAAAARMLRRLHDTAAGFAPPPDASWRFGVGAPHGGGVICHNDVAPYNTIVAGGRPIAFIDWDFAAPGPPEWDVAHALWRFAPLYGGGVFGGPAEQARRMRVYCAAYGLEDRRGLLDVVERRQVVLYESLRAWAAAGDPAFAALLREGHGDGVLRDLAYLRENSAALAAELEAAGP